MAANQARELLRSAVPDGIPALPPTEAPGSAGPEARVPGLLAQGAPLLAPSLSELAQLSPGREWCCPLSVPSVPASPSDIS